MYFPVGSIAVLSLLTLGVEGTLQERRVVQRGVDSTTWKPTAFAAASPNTISSHVLELSKRNTTNANPRSAAYLRGLTSRDSSSGSSPLISLIEGEEYATSITIGTQTFEVIVDTGSSDTWVVETGFECVAVGDDTTEPESECAFGAPYTIDSTFTEIEGEFFNITYGDGESVTGILGTEIVTLANVTVNQTIAVANWTAWEGDGTTSGLTGLAYPGITSAYSDSTDKQIVYNPIFTTMYKEGLVAPLFSLLILRDVSGPAGYLTLGGLPPISFTQNFTSTPILVTTIEGYPQTYDFYAVNIDAVTVDGLSLSSAGGSSIQYIVDSGTTLNYYPTPIADAVNAAFFPPAVYSEDDGAYIVDCNAKPPSHGVTIGGTTFYINPLDLILYAGTDENGNAVCISGVDDGGDEAGDVYVLGDTFQKNVVSVFDVGAVEMRFAGREFYSSNDQY